jgi:hypothetical protein
MNVVITIGTVAAVVAAVAQLLVWRQGAAHRTEQRAAEQNRKIVNSLPEITGAARQLLRNAVAEHWESTIKNVEKVVQPIGKHRPDRVSPLTVTTRQAQLERIRLEVFAMLSIELGGTTGPSADKLQDWLENNATVQAWDLMDLEFRLGSADDAWASWLNARKSRSVPRT